jgi:uncharacterized protein YukE
MAQGQVNINPDEVELFVREIINFLETQQQATNRLNHAFDTLSNTWQDEKRIQFEETYRELLQILSRFENTSNEQVGYLKSLISIQREYQSR